MVGAQLTPILMLMKPRCHVLYYSRWLLLLSFSICATQRHLDCPRCKTRNHWCSVDVHFQDRAASVSLLLVPNKTVNIAFLDVWNQPQLGLPKMQSQQSLPYKNCVFSIWADKLCRSARAPSEPLETLRWHITPHSVAIQRVALHSTRWLLFHRVFSSGRPSISNDHFGVVANCDHTLECVH
jgi:hypothetical protein